MRSSDIELCGPRNWSSDQNGDGSGPSTVQVDAMPDWNVIWPGCERRLRCWRVPPRWSAPDWFEEMQAEGALAALLAAQDYQPKQNVPFGAYLRMRIMGQVLARYRKEWAYALRQDAIDHLDAAGAVEGLERATLLHDELAWALVQLHDTDQWLIDRLFWCQESEAEIARTMGVSQQAVNKRKQSVFNRLRSRIPVAPI